MTKDEALKLALETFEEINKLSIGENAICLPAEIDTAMDAIKEALAQPERDPWREAVAQPERDPWREAAAQPESEPTAWKKKGAFHFCNQPPVDVEKWIPLYKSHTQHWQTWASLTDEEIETIHRSAWIQSTATLSDFARAVEAKLKEKNTCAN